ncbi:MAG: 30S ribosomal protein S15 [Candidatus Sungbacteria bacterium]|nr:30S ribosomal protein S15 [Candidatus Sungbacteria bacterium]
MALAAKEKAKIIEKFRSHDKDTGSSEVQIAVLSEEIVHLTGHLKKHAKDFHSRRGLLGMVARRKKLLDYLKEKNARKYNSVIKKLGLKR